MTLHGQVDRQHQVDNLVRIPSKHFEFILVSRLITIRIHQILVLFWGGGRGSFRVAIGAQCCIVGPPEVYT